MDNFLDNWFNFINFSPLRLFFDQKMIFGWHKKKKKYSTKYRIVFYFQLPRKKYGSLHKFTVFDPVYKDCNTILTGKITVFSLVWTREDLRVLCIFICKICRYCRFPPGYDTKFIWNMVWIDEPALNIALFYPSIYHRVGVI